jgi:hypothetical protein
MSEHVVVVGLEAQLTAAVTKDISLSLVCANLTRRPRSTPGSFWCSQIREMGCSVWCVNAFV